ncbi:hypothetical protein KA005_85715 [bacterium]|nr:hypothetical protein [bacterium]
MESKIIKTLVVLGVPGVALGVFYLLLRQFNFQFDIISPSWAAIIAILFLLTVAAITLYAIHRWAPESKSHGSLISEQSTGSDLPDIRVKATWGVPEGIGPNVNSLLCIHVQNYSNQPFFFDSLYIQLSNGKTMVPRVDAFDKPVPGPTRMDPGSSLNVYLDFFEIVSTADKAGKADIQMVVVRDQIDRTFRSSTEEMQIAISNMEGWQRT